MLEKEVDMKYRKKHVEIEAIIFTGTGENIEKLAEFMCVDIKDIALPITGGLEIKTLEGTMLASEGDYIIKGIQGEFYPCKPDIFLKSYEPVN